MRLPLFGGRVRTPAIIVATAAATAVLVTATSAAAVTYYVKLNTTNYGTAQTTIKNSNGIALGLYAKTGYPPLYVNSTKVVGRLNADLLDGLHATSFAKVAGKTGIIEASDAGAKCPSGTIATGGGGTAYIVDPATNTVTTDLPLHYSGPDFDSTGKFIPNSWIVLPPTTNDVNAHIDVFVECYNPNGAVAGATSGAAPAVKAAGALTRLKATLAR
jgi:hypothetical protein